MNLSFLPKARPGVEADIAAGDVPVMVLALDIGQDDDWWLVMYPDGRTSWALRGLVTLGRTMDDVFPEVAA